MLSPPATHHHITSPLRLAISTFIIAFSVAELSPVVPIVALRLTAQRIFGRHTLDTFYELVSR